MELDSDRCYRALRTRDPRFDGRFVTAVRSTGIFCRPICPARTPRRENCLFLPCPAAARERGFRPCLRCRPEAAPGTPAWHGTSATVSRALRLIADDALDGAGVDALARRLGVGDRHLRRLFARHLGASPLQVAQTRRVLFAKTLIDDTALPMTEVALAAGFGSVRRFNAAVRACYGRPPGELRRRAAGPEDASELHLRLPFRAPYAWAEVERFLAGRAIPGVEQVEPGLYRRTVRLPDGPGRIEVRPELEASCLRVRLRLPSVSGLAQVAERLRRLFDTRADPQVIDDHLSADPRLAPLVRARPGIRIPGAWDPFETAVRAVLGQQVSVAAANRLAARLVTRYGEPITAGTEGEGEHPGGGPDRLFPTPEALETLDPDLVGLPRARGEAVARLARAFRRGQLALDGAGGLDGAVESLVALPGLGRWTAGYVALRALGEPDAFPSSDLGLRRAWGTPGPPASEQALLRAAEAWRPWRGYAALLLWSAPSPGAASTGGPLSSTTLPSGSRTYIDGPVPSAP